MNVYVAGGSMANNQECLDYVFIRLKNSQQIVAMFKSDIYDYLNEEYKVENYNLYKTYLINFGFVTAPECNSVVLDDYQNHVMGIDLDLNNIVPITIPEPIDFENPGSGGDAGF